MFSANAKMSLQASDVQTDEDYEELVEDGFSLPADVPVKKTKKKVSSGKPPPSPGSPYLTSLNVNHRRAAVGAWRLPRASLGDTRLDTPGETGPARLTSLSNGLDVSQTLRSECDATPELLMQTLSTRKSKHLRSASNGLTLVTSDFMKKEDMYDEIIHLKKSLHEQKSDNQQMKAKLRRLEEDNAKREKQIESLLDPTKGSEYTRSLVDRKREGSVVINGLRQRILKLEQQCREKENALREWSKQRLLRRLLEVEKRLEDSKRHAQSPKNTILLDKEVQTTLTESLAFTMATEAVVSGGTLTDEREEVSELRERSSQLEEEKMALEELLSSRDDEVKQLKTEREKLEKATKQWKAEQKKLHDEERRQHKQELKQLRTRIQTLEEENSKLAPAELSSLPPTLAEETRGSTGVREGEERDTGSKEEAEGGEESVTGDGEKEEKEKAALDIQICWREHRNRDTVMLQSALRGHLFRDSQLKELPEDALNQVEKSSNFSDEASSVGDTLDDDALTTIQSACRGHLARCSLARERSVPSLMENNFPTLAPRGSALPHPPSKKAQSESGDIDEDAAFYSDDSDDIIVSPSRPSRS
ncbi:IQ domain-containing protein E [Neolamprologus brichardi]|uniref:IQ domain-containing protein E n=1 Tax=Neolamprologus brichardi TaxID=32507 RepID=UPI0016439626|nr:IQ domain-containing protein E [Neolamprologus brichardi]